MCNYACVACYWCSMFTRKNRNSYDLNVAGDEVHGSYVLKDGIQILGSPDGIYLNNGAYSPSKSHSISSNRTQESTAGDSVSQSVNSDKTSLSSVTCDRVPTENSESIWSKKNATPNGSLQRKAKFRDNLERLRQRKSSLSDHLFDGDAKNRYSLPASLANSKVKRTSLRKRLSFRIFDRLSADKSHHKSTNSQLNLCAHQDVSAKLPAQSLAPTDPMTSEEPTSVETESDSTDGEPVFLFCRKKSQSLLEEILAETNNIHLKDIIDCNEETPTPVV